MRNGIGTIPVRCLPESYEYTYNTINKIIGLNEQQSDFTLILNHMALGHPALGSRASPAFLGTFRELSSFPVRKSTPIWQYYNSFGVLWVFGMTTMHEFNAHYFVSFHGGFMKTN